MPPRSASSAGPPGNAFDAEEYDDARRKAVTYLFTRPVDQSLPDSIEYHHWALVFVFKGDDVRTAEGLPNDSGKLYPRYTKLFPEESGRYYEVGTIETSPAVVLQEVKKNCYNDAKYLATWQNCQTWVKALAHQLGGQVGRNIDDYKTLKEANLFVAAVGKKKISKQGFGSFSS